MSNPASLLNTAHYREFLKYTNSLVAGVNSVEVVNATGTTIAAGRVVYINGVSGTTPTIALARANAIGTMPALGITTTSIANNQRGVMQFLGALSNVDTSAFAAGNRLYVSAATAGALTATAPVHPNISQAVAIVTTVSSTAGVLFLLPGIDPHGIELGTYSNSLKIGDGTAGAKSLVFSTTAESSLAWAPTAARTLTLPDATDTLVGRATTDTLSNKTYTGVSIATSSGGGFNGAAPQPPYSLGSAATGSTQTTDLANNLRAALIAWGIGS